MILRPLFMRMLRPLGCLLLALVVPPGLSWAQTPTCPAPPGPPCQGGVVPTPYPVFPSTNWWNLDITTAPVDTNSSSYITFIGGATRHVHPDFGGLDTDTGPPAIFGFPYVVVTSAQPKVAVQFEVPEESDGVDHTTETSIPFYPIPTQAINTAHWVEGGAPGNVDDRDNSDRHLLIIDKDNKFLYELYNVFYDGTKWNAFAGAFFDMNTNNRRPETWTSADAAGLAILPGLVRYEEAYAAGTPATTPIGHAFRVTVQNSNGHVFPASHTAGSAAGALPMGARLRLKPGKTVPSADPGVLRIVQALKTYGLIVADNGSNMFISGTFDERWDNDILNPALGNLTADDFEVIQLGFAPPPCPPPAISINDVSLTEGNAGTKLFTFAVTLSAAITATCPSATVHYQTANGTATAPGDYVSTSGDLTFAPGVTSQPVSVTVNGDAVYEPDDTFTVNLSAAANATIADAQGFGTILNDDVAPPFVTIKDVLIGTTSSGTLGGPPNDQTGYRYHVESGRSYCVEVDNGRSDVSIRDTAVTVYAPDLVTIRGGSDDFADEPSAPLLSRFCYIAPATEDNVANVTAGAQGTPGGFRIRVVDTTLFCPGFISGSGFEAFILIKNTTAAAHSVTVRLRGANGAPVGTPRPGIAPANGSFNLQVSASGANGFGLPSANAGVLIAHDGPPGGVIANVTSLNFGSGVSFDTQAAPRQDPR